MQGLYITDQLVDSSKIGSKGYNIDIDNVETLSITELLTPNQTVDITTFTIANCVLPIGFQ